MSGTERFIEVDLEDEIGKIIRRLRRLPDQIKAPDVLTAALNETALKVRRQMVKDTKKQYAIKDTSILRKEKEGAPRLMKAGASDVAATIQSRGPMQDIMKFMTRPNSSTGAADAKILNSSSMKPLEAGGLKAFVTRFASGHQAIVQRNPGEKYKAAGAQKRLNAHYEKGRTWPPDMTQIRKLLSPAVPHMLANEEVRMQAEQLTYQVLQEEISKKIDEINARS